MTTRNERSAPPSYTPASTPTARDDRRPGVPPRDDDNALESLGKAIAEPVKGAAEPDEKRQTGEAGKASR